MFLRLLICCAGLTLLLTGCRTPRLDSETVQRSQPLLGTFVTITAHGENRDRLQSAVSAAFSEIRRTDELLSVHREDSELTRLNQSAGKGPLVVPEELHTAVSRALAISEETGGAFDVTIGPIAQLWGFIWKDHRLPTTKELQEVLPLVNHKNVVLRLGNAVELRNSGMQLDFGGIGKGMAVDAAIEVLRQYGVRSAMVKAGGDLRVIGTPPGESAWEVQLEDPAKQGRRTRIRLGAGALSTSGNYENYFVIDGERYSHIINPRTGLPAQGLTSCTVVASTCTESDALATAFFVLGIDASFARFSRTYPIRFVSDDFELFQTEDFTAKTMVPRDF